MQYRVVYNNNGIHATIIRGQTRRMAAIKVMAHVRGAKIIKISPYIDLFALLGEATKPR